MTSILKVKLLDPKSKAPTCAHPGEDLGYDLYALGSRTISFGQPVKIRTGIAVECCFWENPIGLLIMDRSSMTSRGIHVIGGVIDAGYRGEIFVILTNTIDDIEYTVLPGDKIAQLVPHPIMTGEIVVTDRLSESIRAEAGFGSTGV